MNDDDRRIYDLVARRFLAVFHPEAEFENTRVETTVAEHVFRTRGKVLLVPGWRGVYGELPRATAPSDDDEGRDQQLPKLEQGEAVDTREVESLEKETKPPRRYSDASLLGAMETAGKLVDDDELREAMKESGIGTPATRAAIIERLIDVGYVERDGRALVATEKGMNVIRLLGEHPLTSPSLTGDWEQRLAKIEARRARRARSSWTTSPKFAGATVGELDAKLKDVRIPRANLGPCPVCGHDIMENRKGYSCWSREDPGCGFVIWKSKAGKQLPAAVAKELIATGRTDEAGHRLQGPLAAARSAPRLALEQNEEGKWRVEFDEPWAKEGAEGPPRVDERRGGRCRGRRSARRLSGRLSRRRPACQAVGAFLRPSVVACRSPWSPAPRTPPRRARVLDGYRARSRAARRPSRCSSCRPRPTSTATGASSRRAAPCSACAVTALRRLLRARPPGARARPAGRARRASASPPRRRAARGCARWQRVGATPGFAARARAPRLASSAARASTRGGSPQRCATAGGRGPAAALRREVAALYAGLPRALRATAARSTPSCTPRRRARRAAREPAAGAARRSSSTASTTSRRCSATRRDARAPSARRHRCR